MPGIGHLNGSLAHPCPRFGPVKGFSSPIVLFVYWHFLVEPQILEENGQGRVRPETGDSHLADPLKGSQSPPKRIKQMNK